MQTPEKPYLKNLSVPLDLDNWVDRMIEAVKKAGGTDAIALEADRKQAELDRSRQTEI